MPSSSNRNIHDVIDEARLSCDGAWASVAPMTRSQFMRIAPRSLGKAAVAAGSAVLLLGVYGDPTSAAANIPTDLLPCDTLGNVLPPVGQICSTVDDAVSALPIPVAVPDLPIP